MNLVKWPTRNLHYKRTPEALFCYAVSFTAPDEPDLHSFRDSIITLSAPHVNLSDIDAIMWPDSEEWLKKHQNAFETLRNNDRWDLASWLDDEFNDQSIVLSAAAFLGETVLGFKNRLTDEFFRVSRSDLTDAGEALVSAMENAYPGNPVHILTFMLL